MLLYRIVNTEGSLLTKFSFHKKYYVLKKDPYNNLLWKSLKKGSFLEKNKKLFFFKQKILNKKL
jgi:hypothetical protein